VDTSRLIGQNRGPTSVFDNRVESVADGKDLLGQPHRDYLFASDDLAEPASEAEKDKIRDAFRVEIRASTTVSAICTFARLVVENALPAAKRAGRRRPSRADRLLAAQSRLDPAHGRGWVRCGAMEALSMCDNNLMRVRAAIDSLVLGDRTDLMVVSDHGFATIKFSGSCCPKMLGVGGNQEIARQHRYHRRAQRAAPTLIYLSPADFPMMEIAGARLLQKIVDFAEAQELVRPDLFEKSLQPPLKKNRPSREHARQPPPPKPYLGLDRWKPSASASWGLYNAARSPDLVISFREDPNSGQQPSDRPRAIPAFQIGKTGQVSTRNKSAELIRPVKGRDVRRHRHQPDIHHRDGGCMARPASVRFTTSAPPTGPDFRRGFIDLNPTANIDVAPDHHRDSRHPAQHRPGAESSPTGRPMTEALTDGRHPGPGAPHAPNDDHQQNPPGRRSNHNHSPKPTSETNPTSTIPPSITNPSAAPP